MPSRYAAVDMGAESGRVMVGSLDADRLSLQEAHRFPNPSGRLRNTLHWDLLAQWEHIKAGIRAAGRIAADASTSLAGIGIDTWGVDYGLLDSHGNLLANPVCYRDARTDGVMDKVFAAVGADYLYQRTGIQFMQFNTVFQLYAQKLAGDPVLDSAHRLLLMPDLFHYLLCGVARAEVSIASTTQMLSPATRTWDTELLGRLGLPARILPEIVDSGTTLGPVLPEIARECELASAVPVITPGSHDTASAVAAVPVSAASGTWCYISSGTWSLMGVELDGPLVNDRSLALSYTNEQGVGRKVRLLKNIMGLWLVQECRRHFARQGHEYSYAQLTDMAAAAPTQADWPTPGKPIIVDTEYAPFLAPGDMPAKIDEYCRKTDQPAPKTPGQYVRVCLDSLGAAYHKTLTGLEQLIGRRIDTIHIVGGGTQNTLLNQLTANTCQRPVITGPIEATAIGNLLTQAMATGQVPSLSAARQIVRNSFDVQRYEPKS